MGRMSEYLPKTASKELTEALYLLFVKTSTLPVFVERGCFDRSQEGLTVISGVFVLPLDDRERTRLQRRHPQAKDYSSVAVQLDVYCADGEGIGLDEIEYITHMVGETKKESPDLNGFRLVETSFDDIRDLRGHLKAAPKGFERVMVMCHLTMAKESG